MRRREGEGFFGLVSGIRERSLIFCLYPRTTSYILLNYYLRDDTTVRPYRNWSDESWKLGKGFLAAQCLVRACLEFHFDSRLFMLKSHCVFCCIRFQRINYQAERSEADRDTNIDTFPKFTHVSSMAIAQRHLFPQFCDMFQ